MSLSSQDYYDTVTELYSHCDPDPDRCACGGGGWLLSDYDTWHPCSFAGHAGPHPEDWEQEQEEPERDTTFDMPLRNNIYCLYGPLQWSDIPF